MTARSGPKPRPLADRFWTKVDRSGGREVCWPFLGSRNLLGYGSIRGEDGRTTKAHRVAWQLAHPTERLTPDDHICHHCDNPPCCNPAHLYRGDYATNTTDRVTRGRQARGANFGKAIADGRRRAGGGVYRVRRPTHCKKGHDLSMTSVRSGSRRRCGVCATAAQRERRARKRAS